MIPKTPQSYRIPEPTRSEIIALMKDLDLVFVRKSFAPLPESRYIRVGLNSSSRRVLLHRHICRVLGVRIRPDSIKSGISCREFMNRNHHRKDFRNVYSSDYDYQDLSFGWD